MGRVAVGDALLTVLLVVLIGMLVFVTGRGDTQGQDCARSGGVIALVEGQAVCAKVLYTVN